MSSEIKSIENKIDEFRSRRILKNYENDIVIFIGKLTKKTKASGQYSLIKDITVIKTVCNARKTKIYVDEINFQIDHLWINEIIIKSKLENNNNLIVGFGEIKSYSRKDESKSFGISPLASNLYKIAYLKYYLCKLRRLETDSEKFYRKREELERLIEDSFQLIDEISTDNSGLGKLLKLKINPDLIIAILTVILELKTGLLKYDKRRKKKLKQKRSNSKGFINNC